MEASDSWSCATGAAALVPVAALELVGAGVTTSPTGWAIGSTAGSAVGVTGAATAVKDFAVVLLLASGSSWRKEPGSTSKVIWPALIGLVTR
ncbi:hypothetical protein [Actinosynnema sp.]|uniref:hypothetical protein n=1 Tax=Actinosynnema sp. TaxID=1872144 RepID=UPI003F876906